MARPTGKKNIDTTIGEKVRCIRELKKIPQKEVAKHLGVQTATLVGIEKGTRAITIENLFNYKLIFNMSMDEILFFKIPSLEEKSTLQEITPKKNINVDQAKSENRQDQKQEGNASENYSLTIEKDGENMTIKIICGQTLGKEILRTLDLI